jgi:hypothetical protein
LALFSHHSRCFILDGLFWGKYALYSLGSGQDQGLDLFTTQVKGIRLALVHS